MNMAASGPVSWPATVDFLVLGGGPAGSAFAILAARAGASVAIVERYGFADDRPGEQLAGAVRSAIDALGIPVEEGAGFTAPSQGIVSLWAGGAPLTKPYHAVGQPQALRVVRNRFDTMLFEAAKQAGAAAFVPATLIRAVRRRRCGWNTILAVRDIHCALSAGAIIDATGRTTAFSRNNGAHRKSCGDMFALVVWLRTHAAMRGHGGMLTIESCPMGWWSTTATSDDRLVATLFTSAAMMKSARAGAAQWWKQALAVAPYTSRLVYKSHAKPDRCRVFPAFPSVSSKMYGSRWIAIGEAAVAFDPLCGQGVELAIESAFRGFEMMSVEGSSHAIGSVYQNAITDRYREHLAKRIEIYREAADVLLDSFMANGVRNRRGRDQLRR
jgi:flavin-dependent dehydrogenase